MALRRTTRKAFNTNPTLVLARSDYKVLIWSGEHGAYWRANGSGYTTNRLEAGIYSLADAMKRTDGLGKEKRISFERYRNDGEEAETIFAVMAKTWGVSREEAKDRCLKALTLP